MPAKIPDVGFGVHHNYYGMEFKNDIDLDFLIRDPVIRALFEENFADVSDINCIAACVKYPGAVNNFDHFKQHCNLRAENTQGYKGAHNGLNRNLSNLQSEAVNDIQDQLQAQKIELLPSVSSLVPAIKPVKGKTIPFINIDNDEINNVLCENIRLSPSHCDVPGRENISKTSDKENSPTQIVPKMASVKPTHGGEKDERYWKRRMKNNAAAKKSREAKKSRFIFMEERIKELESENAAVKEYLRVLTQKVLESEREHMKNG